jgi:hypothetical protein
MDCVRILTPAVASRLISSARFAAIDHCERSLNCYFGRESLSVIKGVMNPFDLVSLTRTKRAPHKGGK